MTSPFGEISTQKYSSHWEHKIAVVGCIYCKNEQFWHDQEADAYADVPPNVDPQEFMKLEMQADGLIGTEPDSTGEVSRAEFTEFKSDLEVYLDEQDPECQHYGVECDDECHRICRCYTCSMNENNIEGT